MGLTSKEGLTDYNEAIGKFMTNRANSGLGRSTAEQLTGAIFAATTDGKNQLRYLAGADAEQAYGMRQQVGDDAFIAAMKELTIS